jgi:biotin transport system substrate-specific component
MLYQEETMKVRNLILVALFAALTAVGAFIKIPMPIAPITLQTLFCMMAGMLLGPWLGSLSQVVYVVIGLAGVPVFTGGGGPGYIFQPTFGYLVGLIAGAFLCGLIVEQIKKLSFLKTMCAALACMFAVYLFGVPYLYFIMNQYLHHAISLGKTMTVGFLLFVPGDLLKCLAAAFLAVKLRPILQKVHKA